jgi:tripartite ATP-independent transporter DctP family solute receptor
VNRRRACLTLLLGGLAPRALAEPAALTDLTASDVHVPGYPTVEALRWIDRELRERSGGRLGLRLYHSGQLGREGDSIDLARYGALAITRVNMAALNNPFPLTRVLSLPFVFRSTEHLRRALDAPFGQEILDGFSRRQLVGLAFYDSGGRCFYNTRRPITVPSDLHGLKIRVPPSDLFMAMVRAMGANPTPLPYGEVFSALQTRLIDGAENNWPSFQTTRQFEVATHWSETRHSYSPEALLLSRRSYDALAPADRDLLVDIARASVPVMRQLWDETEAKARAAVLAKGVVANEVDRAAFLAAVAPLMADYRHDDTIARQLRAIEALA